MREMNSRPSADAPLSEQTNLRASLSQQCCSESGKPIENITAPKLASRFLKLLPEVEE
jgi:hypothetical protein